METNQQILFFFSALGAFNGLLLSVYFFFFHRPKKLSNYFLGLLIFALSIRIGKSVMFFFNPDLPKWILQIGLTACFFIGPALFFYLKSEVNNEKKINNLGKITFAFLSTAILTAGFLYPYPTYPEIWNQYYVKCIYWEWLIFMILSLFILRNQMKHLFFQASKISTKERWWIGIYFCNVLIFLAFFTASHATYILGALIFSFSIYLIAMVFLFYRKKKVNESMIIKPKYSRKKIDTEAASELRSKLEKLMVEDKIYINSSLKLNTLASKLNISGHQLSQFLNDNLGKSFSSFVNEYRIQAASKLLTTENQFSLEGIGREVGFSSKSTFFATFKKMKGMTPSQFKNQLKKRD